LVHGGWSAKKALFYNFLSALTAVAGALVVLITSSRIQEVPLWLIAFAAASFLYISMADLIPEIHKETDRKKSTIQLLAFVLGIVAMALLLFLEK
jgi:zinc and cadmium transporter